MSRRLVPVALKCLPFRVRCKLLNLACVLGCLILIFLFFFFLSAHLLLFPDGTISRPKAILSLQQLNVSRVDYGHKTQCRFHMCFDINRCALSLREDILGVYIGGPYEFYGPLSSHPQTPDVSQEYAEVVQAVQNSRYHTADPSAACIIISPFDTLAQERLDVRTMSILLNTLPEWKDGQNCLLFNMLPGQPPHFNTTPDFYYGKAMIAGAGFSPSSFRVGFDVSIPVFNPLTWSDKLFKKAVTSDRPHLLTIISHGDFKDLEMVRSVVSESDGKLVLLHSPCPHVMQEQLPRTRCGHKDGHTHPFPDVLLQSKFCFLTTGGSRLALPDFTDMLMTGCIPVIVSDNILPYAEVLDWTLASVMCLSCDLDQLMAKLGRVSADMLDDWRTQVLFLYQRYFISMTAITLTTLDIINDRVFPMSAKSSDWWNYGHEVSHIANELGAVPTKKEEGFTVVILTYNRVQSLFNVIRNVAKAPSCIKIMVIWNNIEMDPPAPGDWPRVKQKIEIVRSKENKLSNRFYPYKNLTSAVFSLDDDITMLTVDELEFGYKVWQEFPNRLVGFPSRVHIQSTKGNWKYESSWLNNISMVLTGAAFYHKYYHYLYTYVMSHDIREWVDSHMNCEDIAMNFLISNYTGFPPLKVSPRKKFACPSCLSEDSLWNDPNHYKERTDCINIFEKFFGRMPLKVVKFRVDPVLYRMEGVDHEAMAYPDMGEL